MQVSASCKPGSGCNQPSWSVLMHWTPPAPPAVNSLHNSNYEFTQSVFAFLSLPFSAAVFQVMQGDLSKTSLLPTWHSTILTWLDIDGKMDWFFTQKFTAISVQGMTMNWSKKARTWGRYISMNCKSKSKWVSKWVIVSLRGLQCCYHCLNIYILQVWTGVLAWFHKEGEERFHARLDFSSFPALHNISSTPA